MIYEIGWSIYDIKYGLIMLCFIPLLVAFIIFQKKYDTSTEDIDSETVLSDKDKRKTVDNLRGSKSNIKFNVSIALVFLMAISILLPTVSLINKNSKINSYKNGEYEIFTGIAERSYAHSINFRNEDEIISFDRSDFMDMGDAREKEIKDNEKYTVYFTYEIKEETGKYIPEHILRIERAQE